MQYNRKYIILGLYAFGMGVLEAAVVVYLRALFYPTGELFPLQEMPSPILLVELTREVATLVMIWAVGYLFGWNRGSRFGAFLIVFGIWDLVYYLFLYLFIGWPASLFEWDVLFLLPTVWVGPVWAPGVLALVMIGLGTALLYFNQKAEVPLRKSDWFYLILGSVVCIIGFSLDYLKFIKETLEFQGISDMFNTEIAFSYSYVPEHFPVGVYAFGLFLILLGCFNYIFRNFIPKRTLRKGQWM
jgi:hypothetical protein